MDEIKQLKATMKAEYDAGIGIPLSDRIALCQAEQLARIADALERMEKKLPQ